MLGNSITSPKIASKKEPMNIGEKLLTEQMLLLEIEKTREERETGGCLWYWATIVGLCGFIKDGPSKIDKRSSWPLDSREIFRWRNWARWLQVTTTNLG
ncbi:unnamed protein product [Prunus armeniaca]